MVYSMRLSYAPGIFIVGISKQPEPLMNKNIMYNKVGNSVCQNTKTQWLPVPKGGIGSDHDQRHTGYSVENKEEIVPFKPGVVVLFMVVFMQTPKESVHNIFMCKPSHKLHKTKSTRKYKNPNKKFHFQ